MACLQVRPDVDRLFAGPVRRALLDEGIPAFARVLGQPEARMIGGDRDVELDHVGVPPFVRLCQPRSPHGACRCDPAAPGPRDARGVGLLDVTLRPGARRAYRDRGERNVQVELKGRIALVTGASKGVGLACARAFAQVGATVVAVARDAARLEAARVALAVDGVLNSAGAAKRFAPAELGAAAFHQGMDAKIFSTIHVLEPVTRAMAACGRGAAGSLRACPAGRADSP
jgi:hypothetical protein